MKIIFLLLFVMIALPLTGQTNGVKLDNYRIICYDSIYNARQSKTTDLQMKYMYLSIVLQNKSITVPCSVKVFSVTKGYMTVRPFNAVSYAVTPIELKGSAGESLSSDEIIILAPNTSKEFFVYSPTIQLLEVRLEENTGENEKTHFYIKGVKQVQDRE